MLTAHTPSPLRSTLKATLGSTSCPQARGLQATCLVSGGRDQRKERAPTQRQVWGTLTSRKSLGKALPTCITVAKARLAFAHKPVWSSQMWATPPQTGKGSAPVPGLLNPAPMPGFRARTPRSAGRGVGPRCRPGAQGRCVSATSLALTSSWFLKQLPSHGPRCQLPFVIGKAGPCHELGGAGSRVFALVLTGHPTPPEAAVPCFVKNQQSGKRLRTESVPTCEQVLLHSSPARLFPARRMCRMYPVIYAFTCLVSVSIIPHSELHQDMVKLHLQHQPVPARHTAGAQERSDELMGNSASVSPFMQLG